VGLVRDVQAGRGGSSVSELFGFAVPVLLPLIGVGLLSGIAIGIGIVLFIAPGLILPTISAVIAPAIVIERRSVFGAFSRSRQLVRGSGWPVFGVVLTAFLISLLPAAGERAGRAEVSGFGPDGPFTLTAGE
jgi:hypothetical protein